jgi:hypothetical protein
MTTNQTFQVTVGANVDANGAAVTEPPFLNPIANQVVATNQTDVFQLPAINPTGGPITFQVAGGITGTGSTATFSPVQNATATVNANGTVTVVPNSGFTGVINLLVGVQGSTVRNGGVALGNPANFFTKKLTLTVQNGQVVNLPPIAEPGSATVQANTSSTIQLTGNTGNPGTSQTLTFQLLSSPKNGAISNFNATTGAFTYTPAANFQGTDTVRFQVTQVGASPNLTSQPATFTINVGGATTGFVRLLDGVLIVNAPPRIHGTNVILVNQTNGNLVVSINGQIDSTQPAETSVDLIRVYGSKGNDQITIDPSVTTPATLNGGRGGTNTLVGGGGSARLHGWFGKNLLVSGADASNLIGRTHHVAFRPKNTSDLMYAGQGSVARHNKWPVYPSSTSKVSPPIPPQGTFFRLINGKIVPVKLKPATYFRKDVPRVGSKFDSLFGKA